MMKKKAFTLIELLVVIAIIAVLMGILMPALRKVREQAKQKSCATRIRQHVLALHMYADDNNGKFALPDDGGYWLWDLKINTVNFMLRTGLTPDMFYCPSNDNQQKHQDLYWEFNGEFDGKQFTSGSYIVSGYCYLLETAKAPYRPGIPNPERKTGPKSWVKTNRDKNPSQKELVIDATLGQPEGAAGSRKEYNFGLISVGGMFGGEKIYDRTSHLKDDYTPLGGNIGFLDSHVSWRSWEKMEKRYNESPAFFW